MNQLYLYLSIIYAVQFFEAFNNTKRKERYMIDDGGEPLPRSSYVFLVLQYFLREVLAVSCAFIVPKDFQFNISGLAAFIAILFLIPLIARVVEVCIRVLIVKYLQNKYIKHIKENTNTKETD